MKNIRNKELQRMKELMGNKKPINENLSLSSVELKKKAPNGKVYGVVKENKKYFIQESVNGVNFDFIGGVGNKTKNQFNSYEEAVRRLNIMLEDTDVLTPDVIEEKKFVIKTKKKKSVEPKADTSSFDFGGDDTDSEEGGDFDFGGDEEETDTEEGGDFDFGGDEGSDEGEDTEEGEDFDFGGDDTEETSSDEETDEDLDLEDDGEDSIKSIQKMTGKLGQKLRDTEDKSSDLNKWVAKSVLSALNLEDMDSEDKKDLIRTIKKKKDEGSDEEFDFMDDEKGTMSLPIMTYMSDDMVDWNQLSDEEKANVVNYPGDDEQPMMDWDSEVEYDAEDMCSHCGGLGHDDMTGEECEWCMGTGVENMEDFMEDDMYGPGDGNMKPGEVILDDEDNCSYCGDRSRPYYEDENEMGGYPGMEEDWMSDPEDEYDNVSTGQESFMSRFAKNVKRAVPGKKMGVDEIDSHLKKIQSKLGGASVAHIDGDKVVGTFGYVEVKPTGYMLHKEGSKFGKPFGFEELGKLQKSIGELEEDYMDDPYMMPQTAPSRPKETPDTPTKPGRPDTDKPSPSKRPFTPPPHITPGEEPNPKAEYDEYGDEYYGSSEGMSYMEEPNYYGSFEKNIWFTPNEVKRLDTRKDTLKGPSYEYDEFEYPDYESFRSSEFGKDPKNKWFGSGESGKRYFDMYSKKFGPMKIRKKIETDFDQTSKMFDDLDYMEDSDVDLGRTIKGRPSNNPIAARGNVSKTYLTDIQKRNRDARKQANNDISKHFRKEGDFLGNEPSDEWGGYSLPYDTRFDDEDYMEDDTVEMCSACEGRGHERGGIGFGHTPKICITCAGSGQVPRMEMDGEVDEPYTDSTNPMGYGQGTSTLPKGMGNRYQYIEIFNFPFNLGENSKRNKRTIKEDHLNNKMASYEQEMAYEDVEDMARQHGMDVEFCHKDMAKDPEEQTIYLDLMKKGKAVVKIRINTAGDIEMGDMKGKAFKGEPVDSHSDFDEVLDEKGIKMMPQTAPSKPKTQPGPDVKPGRPDTDKPSPSKRPFTPPPHITPGEEPNPKARGNRR
jgi:hypothetical protein